MNYYNQVKQKTYVCFLCGRENMLEIDYQVSEENVELTYPSYHVLGGDKYFLFYLVSTHKYLLRILSRSWLIWIAHPSNQGCFPIFPVLLKTYFQDRNSIKPKYFSLPTIRSFINTIFRDKKSNAQSLTRASKILKKE